jgi:hypothetical protein
MEAMMFTTEFVMNCWVVMVVGFCRFGCGCRGELIGCGMERKEKKERKEEEKEEEGEEEKKRSCRQGRGRGKKSGHG